MDWPENATAADVRSEWMEFMGRLAVHAGQKHRADQWERRPMFALVWARDTAKAAEAGYRLMAGEYLPWQEAGGPDQCHHGYAAGIPCRTCDENTVTIWRTQQQ